MNTTRRQFIGYSAALTAASVFSCLGYRHLNAAPTVSVNRVGLPLGHLLRDRKLPYTPKKHYQCQTLILGSGAAGLSALWYLSKHGHRNVLLAEGLEPDGNNAAYRFSDGLAAPGGAHYLALPSKESSHIRDMLRDFDILQFDGSYCETDLVHAPEARLFYRQSWQADLLPEDDDDSRRFFTLIGRLKKAYGSDGKKIFAIPIALSSQDTQWRALDKLTFAQWLDQERYHSPTLRWYLDYCCRDDYGQGIAQVSAFAGLHYFAARNSADTVLTWPQGLAHLSAKLREKSGLQNLNSWPSENLIRFSQPASIHASALKIHEHSDGVDVLLYDRNSGETYAVTARHVISAMPLMVAAHIVDKPQQYGLRTPEYTPWLVGNFVLNSFPKEQGNSELAWDNVVYGSQSLGYVVATHQYIRVAKPERTIFTAYTALSHDTPQNIRYWLLEASSRALLETAAQDLLSVYGQSFWQHVEHVDLTVRGHAMSVPKAGYLDDSSLIALREHHSKLLFAHSDLSGYSVFEEAAYWGIEAAKKVLE
ncbi:NAD(P)/FAD-dependent oxidoreductase [Neisseria iguanae]|uniref:Twin-arginine translocation pathway signal n=1 Tax=Neisseria iguanae TaxID=90242 RepID=A0A2P7TZK8_9NEIS|nr:NAD(P)/FAD-dependent oxidoreductase [Neisseria iguanae]PSJ80125.1 twin-arginine translocation pathway signal [Neisseria iguanae]